MSMSRKPRAQRRKEGRLAAKDIRDRVRLAETEPGGARERPIVVMSASLVEPKARSMPCAVCGSGVRLTDHTALASLRLAHVTCPTCGYARVVYFEIRSAVLH